MLSPRRIRPANDLLAFVGQLDLVLFLVNGEVPIAGHVLGDLVRPFVDDRLLLGGRPRLGADNERRARLVDEDVVPLVDQGKVMAALHLRVALRHLRAGTDPRRPERGCLAGGALDLEPVAQEVEAELAGGAVGDVALVRLDPRVVGQFLLQDADRQAQGVVDPCRPLGVAQREVIVDRRDVDALADQRVQGGRQGRDQRLAFTGRNLGHRAVVQHGARGKLHVERP